MTIKNSRRNISAEPGDIVIDVTNNTLTKTNNNSNFSNNLTLTIKQQDYISETNTPHTKTIEIPMSELVRLAYLQNNYYSKTQSDTRYNVTVEQVSAETGFASSYIVKQNGSQVGDKINIPKDLLLQSAELKTVGTTPTQEETNAGLRAKEKYILFIVNTKDNDNAKRLLLSVNDLVDVYTADESTLTLSNTNQFSIKDGGVTQAKLATTLQNTITNKVDKVSGKGLSTNDYTNADKELVGTISSKATTNYVDEQILGILDPSGVVRLEIASKADADHVHGNITNQGKLSTANGIVITDANQKITATSTIKKNKISDFAHTHTTADSTESSAFTNIGSSANATQHTINDKINIALGNKVDKISGKGLSTNDFTNDLLTKLNGIATEANKYVHPTSYGAKTGKPTGNQAPAFGGTVTISQVTSDASGHVTAMNDRTITIPSTEATTSTKGLMTTAHVTKLNGIATEANKYVHPTSYGAKTGKPTSNQTPAFGGTVTISQVTSDASGHVTAMNDRTITIPSSTVIASGANGLMTGTDKAKLDGIATGANKTTVSNSLTDTSTTNALSAAQGRALNDNLNTLNSKYKKIDAIRVRLIRLQSNGSVLPQDTEVTAEAGVFEVQTGYRLTAQLFTTDSSISIANQTITLIFGSTMRQTTTNSNGFAVDTIGLNNQQDGIAYAILKGTSTFNKDIDIKYIKYM